MNPDSPFKETQIAWHRLRLALRRCIAALHDDAGRWKSQRLAPPTPPAIGGRGSEGAAVSRPAIFVSYATDDLLRGSHQFCGGEKLLNNLVLLLRRHGYEAWMVSTDGKHAGWLAEHAPFLSVEEFRKKMSASRDYRCVTSWIPARAFLEHCPRFYFWDQELGVSARSHFPGLAREMARGRIVRTAGVNRVVQTWHMATFGGEPAVLRQLVDEKHWQPAADRRVPVRIGYFDEGDHTESYINAIRGMTRRAGLELEFHQLRGIEREIIEQMQTCGIFLALNIGKSPWGEGGPMTPQEAMACGTVPVCFDLKGAWEFIQQGYNGVITSQIRPELMAEAVISINSQPGRLAEMSRRCVDITRSSHTMEARWDDVVKFLDLPE